jgi:phospholipid N-methyltransferase
MPLTDNLVFLQAWFRTPRRVGAVMPSGSALARLITAGISEAVGPVIELGPGTGVFTRALLARGVRPEQLALIETNPHFARSLTRRHPQSHVLSMDATRLGHIQPLFGNDRAGAIVSGLPLLSMPALHVSAIVQGAFERQLRADGVFYQFTYGPRCPLPHSLLERLGLKAQRVGSTLFNLPPASVYRVTRRESP